MHIVPIAVDRAAVCCDTVVVLSGSPVGVAAGRDPGVPCVVGIAGDDTTARQLRAAGATEVSSLPQLPSRWARARLMPA